MAPLPARSHREGENNSGLFQRPAGVHGWLGNPCVNASFGREAKTKTTRVNPWLKAFLLYFAIFPASFVLAIVSNFVGGEGLFAFVAVMQAISIGLGVCAGVGWLLFRRCKFSVAQILAAVFTYGLVMSAVTAIFRREPDQEKFITLAIANFLAVSVGLFIGARNMQAMPSSASPVSRRIVFACGLLIVYAVFGTLIPGCLLIFADFTGSKALTVAIVLTVSIFVSFINLRHIFAEPHSALYEPPLQPENEPSNGE